MTLAHLLLATALGTGQVPAPSTDTPSPAVEITGQPCGGCGEPGTAAPHRHGFFSYLHDLWETPPELREQRRSDCRFMFGTNFMYDNTAQRKAQKRSDCQFMFGTSPYPPGPYRGGNNCDPSRVQNGSFPPAGGYQSGPIPQDPMLPPAGGFQQLPPGGDYPK